MYEIESKNKLLSDKNRVLFSEVVTLRKELDIKTNELEKRQTKVNDLEKKLVL